MSDLTELEDRIEALLDDSGNSVWSTSEIDQAIRLALADLSVFCPARAVTTMDAVDEQYEYNLASISGLIAVVEVWYPYLASDDSYKRPHPVQWRMLDETTLYLDIDEAADAAYDIRIFYDKVQTLAGLDGAASTTLNEYEKSALVLGAAGYAALAWARSQQGQVTVGATTAEQIAAWGKARLGEFQQRTYALASQESAAEDARIGWWAVDKWDKDDL